jgi:methylglutaconyl-CoA hydratase
MNTASTLYENRGAAAWITLNTPDNRNALSEQLTTSLLGHLERALHDDASRCIVLTGAGSAFCAGADLKAARTSGAGTSGPNTFVSILTTIWNSPKPVIAAVNGVAFAGGLGLIAAADIAICVDPVTFSFSEVRIGVIPAIISVVCLPKIGAHHGMRLFLTGETFGAAQAVQYGLIHEAVADLLLEEAVSRQVEMITRGGPIAVAEAKKLVRRIASPALEDNFAWTQEKSAALFASAEAAEGMAAFREKRAPAWGRRPA